MSARNLTNGYSMVSRVGYRTVLVVEMWEKGTRRARIQRRVDEAHESNAGGQHRSGFCRACAAEYLQAMEDES